MAPLRAKVVRHGNYIIIQLAEVAIPKSLFAEILRLIDRLRPAPLGPADRAATPRECRGVPSH